MNDKELERIINELQDLLDNMKDLHGFVQYQVDHVSEDISLIQKDFAQFKEELSTIRQDIAEIKKLQKAIIKLLEHQKLLNDSKADSKVTWLH